MKNKKCLLICAMAIPMLLMAGCGKTTVDLNKYVTIETSGYDSMGTATYHFDEDAFKEDYGKKIKINKDKANGSEMLFWGSSVEALLDVCIDESLDKRSGLSNGDTVTLTWDCEDGTAEEYFNVKLKYSDMEQKVSGLTVVDKINPFDYVDVAFSGTSPNGTVVITPDYNQAEMQYVKFSADKSSGIKTGDPVVVKASISGSVDTFVEKFGTVLSETEKTYVADQLPFYITNVNEIPQDIMDKMIAEGEDAYRAHVAKVWNNPEYLQNIVYAGNYFLTKKEGIKASDNNYLYLVYEATAYHADPEQTLNFYFAVYYKDIMAQADGTIEVDPTSYQAINDTFRVGHLSYIGFEDLDKMVNKYIVYKIDTFEYTTTISK